MRCVIAGAIALTFAGCTNANDTHANTELCDQVAARIRADSGAMSGVNTKDLFTIVSTGDSPLIEAGKVILAFNKGNDPNGAAFSQNIRSRFGSSPALDSVLDRSLGGAESGELLSLPDTSLFMVAVYGGRLDCGGFFFFRRAPSGTLPLPPLPLKGDKDGDNLTCIELGQRGHIARVAGTETFVETNANGSESFVFRVIPIVNDSWQPACAARAEFGARYAVPQYYLPDRAPISESALQELTVQLLTARDSAKDRQQISFGAKMPDSLAENVRMAKIRAHEMGDDRIPAFGLERELPYQNLRDPATIPFMQEDELYIARIGYGQTGCCNKSDPILILYAFRNDKLEPVATALTERSRTGVRRIVVESTR